MSNSHLGVIEKFGRGICLVLYFTKFILLCHLTTIVLYTLLLCRGLSSIYTYSSDDQIQIIRFKGKIGDTENKA